MITAPCVDVKNAGCLAICPVDCIHSDDASAQYFIDPDDCIDCGACVAECPVDAIFAEEDVPADQARFIALNADYFAN